MNVNAVQATATQNSFQTSNVAQAVSTTQPVPESAVTNNYTPQIQVMPSEQVNNQNGQVQATPAPTPMQNAMPNGMLSPFDLEQLRQQNPQLYNMVLAQQQMIMAQQQQMQVSQNYQNQQANIAQQMHQQGAVMASAQTQYNPNLMPNQTMASNTMGAQYNQQAYPPQMDLNQGATVHYNQFAQAARTGDLNTQMNVMEQSLDTLGNVNWNERLDHMAQGFQERQKQLQETPASIGLAEYKPEEQAQIIAQAKGIMEHVMRFDPSDPTMGVSYLHNIVLAAESQSQKVMENMDFKTNQITKTLSEWADDNKSRNPDEAQAMMDFVEICNLNQDRNNWAPKTNRLLSKFIPKSWANKASSRLQEFLNDRKTIDEILTELENVFRNQEVNLYNDIQRLIQVLEGLQQLNRDLRKKTVILENAINYIENALANNSHLSAEHVSAIRQFVLLPLSQLLSINAQKSSVALSYIIQIEQSNEASRILLSTSRETREVGIFALRLSTNLDNTATIQEKAIDTQTRGRGAIEKVLKANADKLGRNVEATRKLSLSSTLSPETHKYVAERLIKVANNMNNLKDEVLQRNMTSYNEIKRIDQELVKHTQEYKSKRLREGMGQLNIDPNQVMSVAQMPQQNAYGGMGNSNINPSLSNLFA